MPTSVTPSIGAAWLIEHFSLRVVNPLTTLSRVGSRRHTLLNDSLRTETYQEAMRPAPNLRAHLLFHLKHEDTHLELLSRLFACCNPDEISAWVASEPSSQYARRTGFLYEWLTGMPLAVVKTAGNYVDVLDASQMVVATVATPNQRWRVKDNMPGTPAFCPTIRLTPQTRLSMALDCTQRLEALTREFGEDLLMKSAVWLTLRESRASFQIEGEAEKKDRINRFAAVLHEYTGQGELPLNDAALAHLQKAILGEVTSIEHFGVRQSPVFVGQTVRYEETIHYVAPPSEDLPAMLDGLTAFLSATARQSAVMRSAVASFGFVYIHPLADGNGRVHRFLINDILRRDGAVPAPYIIPVSGLIAKAPSERIRYDAVLDRVSAPLMKQVGDACAFESRLTRYPDGISSNFIFSGEADARHAWRYLDFTQHVQYLADVIDRTITQDMYEESRYLRSYLRAKAAIKEWVEMPDPQIDRIIRSVEANHGVLSGVLANEIPVLTTQGLWADIVTAVTLAFAAD
jgi:hypothetical protein